MKKYSLPIAIVFALVVGVTVAFAAGLLNLPATPVTITTGPWLGNAPNSTLLITLSDVPVGYDVTNGPYNAWCIEDNHQNNVPVVSGVLVEPTGVLWNKINWVLNNWSGYGGYYDAQIAIWILTGTNQTAPTSAALALVDAADGTFVPGPGGRVAVIAFSDNATGSQYQDTIIEVPLPSTPPPPPPPPPPPDGEGCTPGYWRNHPEDWGPTGYATGDDFDLTFGVDYFNPNITLFRAVKLGGGGLNKVARHGTAALLSAAHPDVDYPYTVAEVIAFVASGNVDPLVTANELGCDIP